jgi:hypothetical protein
MAKRSAKVTPAEIAAAAKALGLNVPIRSAERKGTQIVLHTRSGDFAYTPKAGSDRSSLAESRTRPEQVPAVSDRPGDSRPSPRRGGAGKPGG